jgi:hypothetical protein
MKPNDINKILDLAKSARSKGFTFNPLFVGDAGIGKSKICQQWAEKQKQSDPDFGFIDLRMAYLEAQDLVGMPRSEGGRTVYSLPEFWPTSGSGLLLLEEPNRAHPQTMQALMQLTTDRKVHDYKLPAGWIIAGAINPESSSYSVETMDAALKNRFQLFEINYDHSSFVDFMKERKFSDNVISFVNSGVWTFKSASENVEHYISPRTWHAMSDAELSGLTSEFKEMHHEAAIAILGKSVGKEFHAYCFLETPVLLKDLLNSPKEAKKKLKKHASEESYRGDLLNVTINSILSEYNGEQDKLEKFEDLVLMVADLLPADLSLNLIKEFTNKVPDKNYKIATLLDKNPEIKKSLEKRFKGI